LIEVSLGSVWPKISPTSERGRLVPEILGQTDPVRAKTPISIDIRS